MVVSPFALLEGASRRGRGDGTAAGRRRRDNRPEAMNALNPDLRQGISEAIEEVTNDDDVLVAIMAGEGGRAFCAGMDLKWRAQEDAAGTRDMSRGLPAVTYAVDECPKPIIAAIDGYCLAGGMQLSNRCDIRIATEKSRFGMPEARRALAAVGVIDTPELFAPAGEAAWILLTGGHMTAERANQIGLIQGLVPDRDALFEEAERVAGEIKLCAPLAIRELEQLAALTAEVRRQNEQSEDRLEGPLAFAEKRAPLWKNR
jgi:enoyl-CoA hydratase/carnithine racemase